MWSKNILFLFIRVQISWRIKQIAEMNNFMQKELSWFFLIRFKIKIYNNKNRIVTI